MVVVIGGGAWLVTSRPTPSSMVDTSTTMTGDTNTAPTTPTDTGSMSTSGTYTMALVATHNSSSSCWSVIDGNVYDLTSWIPQHPGGQQAILGLCGKDGTAAFHGQHDDAKRQADILATMKIGVLAQ